MQRNKRLAKLRRACKKRKENARIRKQWEAGRKASQESGAGLLDVARCTKTLKSGKRCSRAAEKKIDGKWRCWQHNK